MRAVNGVVQNRPTDTMRNSHYCLFCRLDRQTQYFQENTLFRMLEGFLLDIYVKRRVVFSRAVFSAWYFPEGYFPKRIFPIGILANVYIT